MLAFPLPDIADGGDRVVIGLLRTAFANGISTEALIRRMTNDGVCKYNHGASGQISAIFNAIILSLELAVTASSVLLFLYDIIQRLTGNTF